jgi:hypothetical protein
VNCGSEPAPRSEERNQLMPYIDGFGREVCFGPRLSDKNHRSSQSAQDGVGYDVAPRYFSAEPFCPKLNDSLFARLARTISDHWQRHSGAGG